MTLMVKKADIFLLNLLLGTAVIFTSFGCARRERELTVYACCGLKRPMHDIKEAFENKYGIGLKIIYAGSNTLLETILRNGRRRHFYSRLNRLYQRSGRLGETSPTDCFTYTDSGHP